LFLLSAIGTLTCVYCFVSTLLELVARLTVRALTCRAKHRRHGRGEGERTMSRDSA